MSTPRLGPLRRIERALVNCRAVGYVLALGVGVLLARCFGVTTRCLSTRVTPEGFKRRRYQRSDGVRVTTIEVPLSVWLSINRQGRSRDRYAEWQRERNREAVRLRAVALVEAGWKRAAVAHELNVSERSVSRWANKGNK